MSASPKSSASYTCLISISVRIFSSPGVAPDSDFLVAFTITMKRRGRTSLAGQWPGELGAPLGRIGVRTRVRRVDLPRRWLRRPSLRNDPGVELLPGRTEPLVAPVVDGTSDRRARGLTSTSAS